MTGYYVRVREDGRHQVFATTNGIDRTDVPHADYEQPLPAIRYAQMREAEVSPLRDRAEDSGDTLPWTPEFSARSLTRAARRASSG